MSSLQLTIVSQEKELAKVSAQSVSVPGSQGELTILPGHVPLVTRLQPGVIRYDVDGVQRELAVSQGFVTVNVGSEVIVMVDSAMEARDISLTKAEEAIARAKEAVQLSSDQRQRLKAEAELRFALLQLRIAQKD